MNKAHGGGLFYCLIDVGFFCYFSLLRQRKVTKRKATQLNRCSLLCFNFLYGNFATRGKAAQTEQNCLKIESRKGDLYGEFFLSSKNCFR